MKGPLVIHSAPYYVDFQIINCSSYDGILGRDFLALHGGLIDVKADVIQLSHPLQQDTFTANIIDDVRPINPPPRALHLPVYVLKTHPASSPIITDSAKVYTNCPPPSPSHTPSLILLFALFSLILFSLQLSHAPSPPPIRYDSLCLPKYDNNSLGYDNLIVPRHRPFWINRTMDNRTSITIPACRTHTPLPRLARNENRLPSKCEVANRLPLQS